MRTKPVASLSADGSTITIVCARTTYDAPIGVPIESKHLTRSSGRASSITIKSLSDDRAFVWFVRSGSKKPRIRPMAIDALVHAYAQPRAPLPRPPAQLRLVQPAPVPYVEALQRIEATLARIETTLVMVTERTDRLLREWGAS